MKRTKFLLLTVSAFIASAGIALVYLRTKEAPVDNTSAGRGENNSLVSNSTNRPLETSSSNASHDGSQETVNPHITALTSLLTEEERSLRPKDLPDHAWLYGAGSFISEKERNGVARFYGKTITENGEPFPGVQITVEVSHYETSLKKRMEMKNGVVKTVLKITTDENGEFSISRKPVNSIILKDFTAPGYEVVPGGPEGRLQYWKYRFDPTRQYEAHVVDLENPELFPMRKIQPHP